MVGTATVQVTKAVCTERKRRRKKITEMEK
jgi:hypothetical protein